MAIGQQPKPRGNANRVSECLTAMEASVRRAMDEAFDAGWTWTEIATAMMEIAMDWSDDLKAKAGDHVQRPGAKLSQKNG